MAQRNLLIRGGADFSGMRKELARSQQNLNNFKSNVKGIMGKIGAALATIGIGKFVKDSMMAASDLESAFKGLESILVGQGRNFAKAKGFIDDYIEDGLVPLTNAVTAYKNLAARGYNDEQIQSVMNRLKDAASFGRQASYSLGEAVSSATEGLKNENSILVDNAGVTKNVAKMWEEYARSIGKTSNQLTQQEKIQAEVNGIIQETQWQVGDAAKYTDTFAGKLAALTRTFNDIRVNIGQAFIPLATTVMPLLQNFANSLLRVTSVVSQFMQALFGKSIKTQSSQVKVTNQQVAATKQQTGAVGGLGKAYKKAGKEATKAAKASRGIAGFDEINQLSEPSDSSGGSGTGTGSGGDIEGSGFDSIIPATGPTEGAFTKISKKVQEFADKVKKYFKPLGKIFKQVYQTVKEYLLEKFEYVAKFWKENSAQMGQAWKNFLKIMTPIVKFIVKLIWGNIKGAIDGLIDVVLGLLKIFTGVFTGDWKKVWEGCKDVFFGAIKAIWNILNLLLIGRILKGITNFGGLAINLFKNVGPTISKWWTKGLELIKSGTQRYLDDVMTFIRGKISILINNFKTYSGNMWNALKSKFLDVYNWFSTNVIGKIVNVFSNSKNLVANKAGDIWTAIRGKFADVYNWFKTNLGDKITSAIANVKSAVQTKANELWTGIKGKFANAYDWFRDNVAKRFSDVLVNWKENIANKAGPIWTGIKDKFKGAYDWFRDNVAKRPMEAFDNWKTSIANAAGKVWGAIKDKFKGAYDWFKVNVAEPAKKALNNIKNGLTEGLTSGFKSVYNRAVGFLNTLISNFNSAKNKIVGVKNIPDIPKIPALAKGGITNGPTLALIGDNPGGREVVSPLDDLQDLIAGAVSSAVVNAMQFSKGSGKSGDVILQLDGKTVGRIINPYIDQEKVRVGKSMIQQI
ncbi:hypothetical protein ACFFF5_17785 [Lederbergia wuyishanensis]|uniref:Uncharacterized protein n=1 Tax=Lederbergia wuyishanensis TaxID=1347903 RepID=A0ABU0D4G1_9BACI|nr:hypothetical protein [Lederbergia wuyishanensis]MCJ8008122.1 hypothetical protein [Lederbergia wuyishanensis]MDQ0343292.1 hypothetical protein [Lederbergia wuyishanensis]